MNIPYGIGLDIGVASVGWAVVELDENAEPFGLIRANARIFQGAEHPKTGNSLAAPRREARSIRRVVRRRALRKHDFYALLEKEEIAKKEEMDKMFSAGNLEDIYKLRARALDETVSKKEFARILLHLMQRRGFKSNRKADKNSEDGKLLSAISENEKRMKENGYRTVGEMLFKDEIFGKHKRNRTNNYVATVSRDEIKHEAETVFEMQRQFGQDWASKTFETKYLAILLRQRSYDQGPGGDSPYKGGWKDEIGKCALIPGEDRAFKNTYTFERSTLLQKINHLRVWENGYTRGLTDQERKTLIDLAYRIETVSYSRIRKELGWADDIKFSDIQYDYRDKEKNKKEEDKRKLPVMRGYHSLRKVLNISNTDANFDKHLLDDIVTVLALHKDTEARKKELEKLPLTKEQIDKLLELDFSKTGNLSIKACERIEPYLLEGLTYDKACEKAGLDFHGHTAGGKGSTLPANAEELKNINNPVVRRSISQTIKVVNAIIRDMGCSPMWIHIEVARELKHSFDERKKATAAMQENQKENEKLMKEIKETFGILNPKGLDLVKYRLWKEQQERCMYSGKPIERSRLFEPGYAEVDHIVPFSISFDDSRNNKVLVLTSENQNKGNRLPLEYMTGEQREDFIVRVKAQVKNEKKKQNLLREKVTDYERDNFRERNLKDTQYIAKFLFNFIQDHLIFAQLPKGKKQHVVAVAGGITATLRSRWGLVKLRENGDVHHAVDAIVIACTTQKMIKDISDYYARKEACHNAPLRFPEPWPNFRKDIDQRLTQSSFSKEDLMKCNPVFYSQVDISRIQPVFVSRMPQHKVTGAAHKETIKSPKALEDGLLVTKQPLTALKLDKKTGEIERYYQPSSDKLLYEALRARLQAFDGDGKKAFAGPEPFHKPKADGTPGPIVRKVKLYEKASLSVPIHGGRGAANNDSMVRTDVFFVPGEGYYLVPVYVSDTIKKKLPDRAVVAHKSYSEWKVMKEEDFLFSLYANDLIEVEHKKAIVFTVSHKGSTLAPKWETKRTLCYYEGMNISTGAITISTPDNAYTLPGLGVKTLATLKKFEVDVLGNVREVSKETRQQFR